MSGDRRWDRKDSRRSNTPKVVNTAEDQLESKLGFGLFSEGETRLGWLLTFASSSWEDPDTGKTYSCVDLYFVTQDGFYFKTKYKFRPYFYAATKEKMELEVEAYLRRRYERQVADIEIVEKEDLDLAYKANVVCPNKIKLTLRSSTKVIFSKQLIDNLDRDLEYAITVEGKMRMDSVSNYDVVKDEIKEKLEKLRDSPIREEGPLIYHLDVAAMYPNIILTNRLQPPSIVTNEVCTACDFNRPGKRVLENLNGDYYHLKKQIESEFVDAGANIQSSKSFLDLPKVEQQSKLKERLKKYCQKAYRRVLDKPITEVREAGICMRENPFYVDTVRSFRDRRYEYKTLNKVWKGKLSEAKASGNSIKIQEAQDMVVVYDSLQLAHKCILNSFYGYVMRKGARWYSMEMAGVVTYTGAKIIQNARLLIERIGKPLELDTDGIWCCLPGSFPENFTFKMIDMKKFTISYPCVMLNVDVAKNNTNDQYQTLVDPVRKTYESHSECSIEFEVDGPYKAMIIPASKEEGILIKKRYAVFNHDGTLAELKGFEIKRRGELKLIKVFQAELFDKFLHGSTLEECYSAVAAVANRWLDLLDNQGKDIADSELLDYISESSTMSKSLADYGEQKSCAVTTAKRLADFLGDTMVKDKGLRCQYIVACEPKGSPVSERAVPVAIFTLSKTEPERMKFYLGKWCKQRLSSDHKVDIRLIIDWSYYKQRLSSAIQKVITIPAAMQKVANPVPRVLHPDWLHKKVREKDDKFRQRKLADMFSSANKDGVLDKNHSVAQDDVNDIEDFCKENKPGVKGPKPVARSYEVNKEQFGREQQESNDPKCDDDISFENIDKNVDYQGWLEVRKRKWKGIVEKKKKRRLGDQRSLKQIESHEIKKKVSKVRRGVGSFFRRPEEALTSSHWQIIQLVPSPQSGQFFAWVVVEGLMLKIPLTIPRVEIQEEQFRKESKKLAALLADPEIEGIYETKVPLEFSAICQIGCVCKIDNTAKRRNTQDGWKVGELHMKTTTECRYLERSIPLLYLYHSTSTLRAIYVLYCHASKLMSAVVVNPYGDKELLPSALERQFRDGCQELSLESLSWDGIVFQVDYVDHAEAAEKIIQKAISEYREENSGPTVVVIECPDFNSIKDGIKALDDFPCVRIPFNGDDNSYQPVSWQRPAAKLAMFRCAAAFQWLDRRISQSRYAHVPLGNFGLDWLTFTVDIFLSRALRDQQQVLWVSDNGVPDLGGLNNEETLFADEVQQTSLVYPGAYRKKSHRLEEIIQLVPSPQSGQFFAWVVVEGLMLKIPLTIPRVFYINSKAPIDGKFPGKCVNKVEIQEEQFRKESKKLAALLADPEIEGIYETKVPLEFSAICQIGCVCKIDNTAKHRNTQDGWKVGELHMKTTTECHYLERSIPLLYLYNSTSTLRAIYVLYCHASKLMSAVVVSPYGDKELLPSALERQFRDGCQESSVESLSWDGIVFQVDYVDHAEAAEKIIQKAISEYREENSGPTVAVIECPDFNSIKEGIKALDDFPCVRIPFNGDDNSYQPVSWQRPAAKLAMFRCAAAFQWLDRRISQSRYAHVPLGNFGLDWLTFTVDIFLSRALRDQQQVLWVSDNGVPDLGGLNNEETFFADEVQQTSLVYPGAYRKVSVELKIHHLAVNALLKSNLVSEMEGGDFLGFEQDGNSRGISSNVNASFDETTGCAQAFRVLKQLIQSCLADVCKSRNIYADSILQRLSWWLCSPCSKLHDPALHLMLHKVMQKVFALLLTDFRRLGATIIYADFSKIVIDTGKFDLSAAKAYCDSLLTAVGNSDIFEWISLEPVHYWLSLLFMDQYNYAGIRATDDEISPDEVTIEPKWSVARLFPEYIQRDFVIIVAKFIFDPWKLALEKKRGSSESLEAQMVEYLKEQIPSNFFNMLFTKIGDITSHMKEIDVSDASRDSSQTPKRDYTLEFVQTICAVLALDQNVEQEVLLMKRNLLKYINVKEFAAEAGFLDPGPSFILPNVACSNCDAYRDLDIGRDPALLTEKNGAA
ncbi:hypothetical protein Bca52824_034066 [Brassica carinata]|uniref:DNA polymerase epsilon catalytic subunit n=1 Tax=Brassica carinata TaxID=52824 RepID=A0A8X7V6N9_BRACI|nr:hypothetical protein Bca52824_034066 [Brassica carinata]